MRRRKLTDTTPFDTLRLEGTLFVPELLERAARGEAAHQKEADYAIPKGLKLHDEYGRAYRIAAALWQDFAPQLPRTDLDPARATHAFVLDLLRQCLGFTDLAPLSAPVQIGDRGFPVTAQALGGRLPVIIAPHSLALDDPDPRFAIHGSGARRKSAHQLAQEFLNASRDCLWAIVTNGRNLRLLRDAETLTRPNFLEFDLETILREGEARYADFSALWRILHASRSDGFQPSSDTCIWEKWKSEGHAQGLRVREGLRAGVTQALLILGRGFLTHPDNLALRQRLHDGTLTKEDYFQQLLRLIYRSLFLFCAEERDLLHTPAPSSAASAADSESPQIKTPICGFSESVGSHQAARKAYAEGYSLRRLRNRSLRQTAHDSHGDLWLSLRIVFRALASGQPRLALPALGGLFAETQCPDLDSAALANRDLLAAMRHLRWSSASGSLTAIDYRNMGPEELGSVYESLLELVPQLDLPARTFGFAGITDTASTSGNARKTTGSYYTPDSLVQELIKSALDPVIADRLAEAGRLANGEWRTANGWMPFEQALNQPEFIDYAHRILSRSGGLAAGQNPRQDDLSSDSQISSRGEIRSYIPNAPRSSLSPLEHRGGLGAALSGGVHPISPEGERQPDRTGNTIPAQHGLGVSADNRGGLDTSGNQSPRTPDISPGAEFAEKRHQVAVLWSQTPFAVRHSLFTCEALLHITVCDPSCGSGHFLLAAARRLAEKLAELRAPDGAVRPDDYRHALREVASRCLYGVDINPMAVELCRVALWLETVDPGKPLGFLNHHIRTGNSLLGTTPDLIAAGLPDDTFTAIEGDDKTACAELKKRNKKEREGFGPLFEKEEQTIRDRLRLAATQIEAMDDSQPAALQQKEAAFTTSETAPEYRHAKLLADLWCAAFVIRKRMANGEQRTVGASEEHEKPRAESASGQTLDMFGHSEPASSPKSAKRAAKKPFAARQSPFPGEAIGITTAHLRDFVQGKPLPADLQTEVEALARQYRFFHWHLAFPQVFDQGGFACILGNPPWEKIKLEEQQWFADKRPDIANATSASTRARLVTELETQDSTVFHEFKSAVRMADGEGHLLRHSGSYPLCARGDINLFAVFAEKMRSLIRAHGRIGAVLPTGIATDDTTKHFFNSVVSSGALVSLFDFSNKEGLFPAVRRHQQFCLFTVENRGGNSAPANFAFFLTCTEHLLDPSRVFELTPEQVGLVNPNTGTAPLFKTREDASLAVAIYQKSPVLIRDTIPSSNPWKASFATMFHMTNDANLFISKDQTLNPSRESGGKVLQLFDPKMAQQYNHRAANLGASGHQFRKISKDESSVEQLSDPDYLPEPLYWVPEEAVSARLGRWRNHWLLGFKDVTGTTSTAIGVFAVIPRSGVSNKFPLLMCEADATGHAVLLACLNSLVIEFILRLKFNGLSLNFFYVKQLPVLPPATYAQPCPWANDPKPEISHPPTLRDWLLPRVLELTYTAWDLEAFASDCGWSGPPFRWDEERRFLLRCELDAAFFHLYLGPQSEWQQQPEALTRAFPTPRHAVSYIMDTFPIVKRKDETKHGHYRTKEAILQIYDALTEAMQSGVPYKTLLNPPPADVACCHPPKN